MILVLMRIKIIKILLIKNVVEKINILFVFIIFNI